MQYVAKEVGDYMQSQLPSLDLVRHSQLFLKKFVYLSKRCTGGSEIKASFFQGKEHLLCNDVYLA